MENSSTISERSQSESPIAPAAAAAATMQRLDQQMATILSKKFDPKTAFNYDLIEHLANFLRLPKTVERKKFQSIARSLDAATILWGGKVSTLGVDVRKMRTTLSILQDARNDDEMAEEEEEIINNIRRNRRTKRTGPASSSHRNNRIIVANIETINEKSPPSLDPPSMMMLTRNMNFCETLLPSQLLSATLHRDSRGLFLASDDDRLDDFGDQILDQNFIDIAKFSCGCKDFARCLRRFPAAVCPVRLFAQFEFRNRSGAENIVVDENTELPVLPLTTEIELISGGDEFHDAFSFDIDAPIIDIPESDPIVAGCGGGLLDDGQNALTENRDDGDISPRQSIYQAQLEPIIAQDDNHLFNEEYLRKKFPRLYSQMLRRQCSFRRNRNVDKKATKRLRARDRLPNVYEASDEGGSNVWRRSARATANSQSISLYPRNIARNWTIARHHMPHNGDVFPDFSELRNFFIAKNHQITEPNRPTEPKRRRQSLLLPRRSSRQPRISSPSDNVAEDVPNDAIMMMQQPQEEEEAAAEEAIDLNNNRIEPRRSFRLSFNLSRKSEFDDSAIMALEIEYAKTATRLDLRALKRTMTLFIDASISSNATVSRASSELRDPTFGTGSSSPLRIRRNRSIKFDALHRHVMMQEQRRQRQKNGARIHCANAFVALLHLANEKKLKLCNENDDGGDDDHHYNYRINSIDDGAALSSANDYSNFRIFC